MTIIITDDVIMFREMIFSACIKERHHVIASLSTASETLALCFTHHPDVLFLDARLPDSNGIAISHDISKFSPSTKIIIVSAYTSDLFFLKLSKAPIFGFIDKTTDTSKAIAVALKSAFIGKRFFSSSYQQAIRRQNNDPEFFGKLLTNREQEVLRLIALAQTDEEIACELGIAARTVQGHRSNLITKLNVDGTPKLIQFAINNGFNYFSLLFTLMIFNIIMNVSEI